MILAKQPSVEDAKQQRELIAHIEPADDELLAAENLVEVITDEDDEGDVTEDED